VRWFRPELWALRTEELSWVKKTSQSVRRNQRLSSRNMSGRRAHNRSSTSCERRQDWRRRPENAATHGMAAAPTGSHTQSASVWDATAKVEIRGLGGFCSVEVDDDP
jgi:hypothetical protein